MRLATKISFILAGFFVLFFLQLLLAFNVNSTNDLFAGGEGYFAFGTGELLFWAAAIVVALALGAKLYLTRGFFRGLFLWPFLVFAGFMTRLFLYERDLDRGAFLLYITPLVGLTIVLVWSIIKGHSMTKQILSQPLPSSAPLKENPGKLATNHGVGRVSLGIMSRLGWSIFCAVTDAAAIMAWAFSQSSDAAALIAPVFVIIIMPFINLGILTLVALSWQNERYRITRWSLLLVNILAVLVFCVIML